MALPDRNRATSSGTRQLLVRPTCTHISMDMVYSAARCQVCGNLPSMGWLYECQQDKVQAFYTEDSAISQPLCLDEPMQITELKLLGVSPSIVRQAEEERYTDRQLDSMKAQKVCVVRAIAAQCHSQFAQDENHRQHQFSATMRVRILMRRTKLSVTDAKNAPRIKQPEVQANARCNLQCCHNCRPYYRDRVCTSIDGVVRDISTAYLRTPLSGVKLLNPRIVIHISPRNPVPKPETHVPCDHESESSDDAFSATSTSFSPCTTSSPHVSARTIDISPEARMSNLQNEPLQRQIETEREPGAWKSSQHHYSVMVRHLVHRLRKRAHSRRARRMASQPSSRDAGMGTHGVPQAILSSEVDLRAGIRTKRPPDPRSSDAVWSSEFSDDIRKSKSEASGLHHTVAWSEIAVEERVPDVFTQI